MQKNTKINKKFTKIILIFIIFIGIIFVSWKNTQNVRSSTCESLSGDDERKCEELEKKAQAYQELIDIKTKQQTTLQKQMMLIDMEQAKTQQELLITSNRAQSLDQKISDLNSKISAKENLIKNQKSILSGLLQTYYEDYQTNLVNIVLADKNYSDIFKQADYIDQTSAQVKDVLESIRTAKFDLETELNEISISRRESEETKKELENKKYNLLSNETKKQSLLNQTQGEESKYRDLLARVEQQKLELFNFGASGNAADVLASVANYPKPDKKNWASTSWYFSQRDSRWGNLTIGNSGSLMKDYGCAVSAVSMVFKYYGASIDPGKMSKQRIFYYDLIMWPASWSPSINLVSSTAHSGVSWSSVDKYLKNKQPVIVYIKKTSGGGGHYVVIHGKDSKDYIVHDPYFGANLYLGTSKALMGAMNPKSSTVLDQAIVYN